VLFQYVVVRVQLLVFLLKAGSFDFGLLADPVVNFELLSHMLKFFLLTHP